MLWLMDEDERTFLAGISIPLYRTQYMSTGHVCDSSSPCRELIGGFRLVLRHRPKMFS